MASFVCSDGDGDGGGSGVGGSGGGGGRRGRGDTACGGASTVLNQKTS